MEKLWNGYRKWIQKQDFKMKLHQLKNRKNIKREHVPLGKMNG